ncbi:MAG: hypothetical protein WCP55_12945 [Lentisphaerota bacterium]
MTKKLNVLLVTVLGLFAAVCVFAEEPEFSVSPGEQNTLRVKIKENVEPNTAEVEFGKLGDMNTAKPKGIVFIASAPPGLNNVTLCGAIKVSGQNGTVHIINYGALNLITPGYCLAAKLNDGKFYLDLLVVGLPDGKDGRYCIISSKGKTFNSGDWIFFTVVINRAGKAEIFVNGELAGSGLVNSLEKDNMTVANAATMIGFGLPSKDGSLELANMEVYYSLLSSVDIDKLKDKWLAVLKK